MLKRLGGRQRFHLLNKYIACLLNFMLPKQTALKKHRSILEPFLLLLHSDQEDNTFLHKIKSKIDNNLLLLMLITWQALLSNRKKDRQKKKKLYLIK